MFQKIMESFRAPERTAEHPEKVKIAMESMDGILDNPEEMDRRVGALEKQG